LTPTAIAIVITVVLAYGPAAVTASGAIPRVYKNCTELNKKYPHGVGRVGARDKSKSGEPVTTLRRSNRLYELNKGLDRDKDRIACEKE